MNILKSIIAILVVLSVTNPVIADTEDVKIIRVNHYELGSANVNSRHMIPTQKDHQGIFAIEYAIAYRVSTTEAVRPMRSSEITATLKALGINVVLSPEQVTPDYIFAEWTFPETIQVSQENNIPKPLAGEGWCGKRDIRLVCAFPVENIVGRVYQIQVTYTPTQNCVCMMTLNTNFSNGAFGYQNDNIVVPVFTRTVALSLYK